MELFGLGKKKLMPPGKAVPLGPPNVERQEEEVEGIKEEVGYPSEEGYTEYEEQPPEGEFAEEQPAGEEEQLPPPPGEYPEFLPPPPGLPVAPPPGASSAEELKDALRGVIEELRSDFDQKISVLDEELSEIKKLDEDLKKISVDFGDLREKYDELDEKISSMAGRQQDFNELKAAVSEISQIMRTALPALIKEVRDLKEKK